jgi:BirA family biotin operon repressor/biotin-[acetyl-CoA-carboxylase] ligase
MDKLSEKTITESLNTNIVGGRVIYFQSLPSTMEVAKQEAASGATDGTVIVASEQVMGRGRFTRQWLSPPGSISLSVILRPDFISLPFMIMLSGVATSKAIGITNLKTQLKWPNDVLVNGRKVCGILTESSLKDSQVDYVVIGIGVNVNMKMAGYPDISELATSLLDELGYEVSILKLLRQLLTELDILYGLLPDGERIFNEWRHKMAMLGKRVQVFSDEGYYEGIAEDVESDGNLLLRLDNGSIQHILAGDVSLRLT